MACSESEEEEKMNDKMCPVCKGTGREKFVRIDSNGEETTTLLICELCQGSGVRPNFHESFDRKADAFCIKSIHTKSQCHENY